MSSIRRHHRARLKNRRQHWWGRDLRAEPKALAKAINTPTPCSCWMCGNPRRTQGERTRQERSADEMRRSGLEEG